MICYLKNSYVLHEIRDNAWRHCLVVKTISSSVLFYYFWSKRQWRAK